MIKNSDGTPYKPVGSLEQFDPDNPERCLWNDWDAELIKIYGSPVFYYEVFIQTGSLDKLYREDRGKLWSNNPITLYASYEPVVGQNYQNAFGIDSPDEVMFNFNYQDVLKRIGHPLKIGSRIYSPHRKEDWVVIQRNIGETMLWSQLRLQVLCQRFQESVTTGEGKVTQPKQEFDLNPASKYSSSPPPPPPANPTPTPTVTLTPTPTVTLTPTPTPTPPLPPSPPGD